MSVDFRHLVFQYLTFVNVLFAESSVINEHAVAYLYRVSIFDHCDVLLIGRSVINKQSP